VHNGGIPVVVTVNNGAFKHNVSLASGVNTISTIATDAAGNTSSMEPIGITMDAAKPSVVIITPTNNLLTNTASQLVSGTVSDQNITSATLLVNGSSQIIPVANGVFSKIISLLPGVSTIEVRGQDSASPPNVGTSGIISITMDTRAPALTIGLSDPADSIVITIMSSESLREPPALDVNGTAVVMNFTELNTWVGVFGSSGSPIPAGDYIVTAAGTDLAGNSTEASAAFSKEVITVNGTIPTQVVSANTTLQVETNGTVANADISVTSHLENPSGNSGSPQAAPLGSGAFLEINAAPELLNNLKQIYIEVAYLPTNLAPGIDQSTLKLYLWDVTTGAWKLVPDSGVNTARKVIWGRVMHLSKYGGFGSMATAPAGGGGGGGLMMPSPPSPGTTNLPFQLDSTGKFNVTVIAKSHDEMCFLTIPKGTFGLTNNGSPLPFITMVKASAPGQPPAGEGFVGLVYEFGPNGSLFDPAVTLTFTYKDSQVPTGADEKKIHIAWRDDTVNWNPLESTVDTEANVVTARISHFTQFALLVPDAPANFITTNLTISPSEVKVLEKTTVTILIANSGGATGRYDAFLYVDGATTDVRKITLAAGASETVSFTIARDKAGSYTISIGSESGKLVVKDTAAPPPKQLKPAAFTSSSLTVTPGTVKTGEQATVSVTVANSGEMQGVYKVTLRINGLVENTRDVTLAGGANQKVSFNVVKNTAGSYSVSIDALSANLVVQPPPPPPPTQPSETAQSKAGNLPAIIAGIIGGLLVLSLVVWLLRTLRRV
jgi:hypothetical protein